jgi:tetratricopeptide (TPR) repeat protein
MNNLAQLYTEAGRIEDATRLYREAIALEDERKGFYALNLADMLMQQGNPKSAITFYRITLEEHPDHPDAQEGLIAAYQAADLPGLVTHLWDQIDRGRQVRATLASLQVLNRLADDEDRPGLADEKTELLTCVVVGLSKAQYGPLKSGDGSIKKGDIEQLLGALANDPDIGAGVTEVLQVYDNPNISPDGRSWWASLGTRERDPDEGWWPRDGYRMLLRSLGAWYARRDWPDIAEAYYRRSVELTANSDNEPDLEALVRLADLFMEQGDIDRVRDLLEASDTELYYGKGQAYRTSSWKKVYAFHRTLGIMYALTENWGASNDVTSATFQLENALEKRELYNRRFGREEDDTLIPLEPRLVNLLAQTYNATGRADEAVPLQLDSAEELFRADTPAGARQILDAMDVSKLDNPSRRRYQALQRRLP